MLKSFFFFPDWQLNELPLHVELEKGQSIQVAVALVTSKGLHVSENSNKSRYGGKWMTTLNGELLREEIDYTGKKQHYMVN